MLQVLGPSYEEAPTVFVQVRTLCLYGASLLCSRRVALRALRSLEVSVLVKLVSYDKLAVRQVRSNEQYR